MTSKVTMLSMAKRFALTTHPFLEFDLLFGEEDQPGSAFRGRKMEKVGPDQKQRCAGSGRSVAGGTPAGARTGTGLGARAWNAHGYAGARGEGAAKVTVGEVVREW
jgi:hypothetical protein